MDHEYRKPVLDPYKTIGCFVHGPVAPSATLPYSLAAACHNSFKVYSPELSIKMVSPCFDSSIRAIQTINELTYVLVGETVFRMRYHHITGSWPLPPKRKPHKKSKSGKNHPATMLIFTGVIIVAEDNAVHLIDEKAPHQQSHHTSEQPCESLVLDFPICGMVHPVTYLNKVLVYSGDRLVLVNPISQKILYEYSQITTEHISGAGAKITVVSGTPLVDIIAVGLDSGQVLIVNIRKSTIVFKMKQKRSVSALAFSEGEPYMASADDSGNIILWDLQEKKIIYRMESALSHSIDHLFFIPGLSLLVATSSYANTIRQFRINRDDAKTLTLFRERVGSNQIIRSLKVHNNKQISFVTQGALHFTSLYSHCNNYNLPITSFALDSSAPFHLLSHHFNIEVYKERTLFCKMNIHEVAELGALSLSHKYAIVVTKSRIIKISISSSKDVTRASLISAEVALAASSNPSEIILHNEHLVYLVCYECIQVYDFSTLTLQGVVAQGSNCYHSVASHSLSMLAFENRTEGVIEVWDCQRIACGRKFSLKDSHLEGSALGKTTALCFTPDNRFVLSSHTDHRLLVWSMVDNVLYKVLTMEAPLAAMAFTPDGGYFLSVFNMKKEINIWNNYIGKITTNQVDEERSNFHTSLRWLEPDYRVVLNRQAKLKSEELLYGQEFQRELDSLLDEVPDAEDRSLVENYELGEVSKWMPLVYYDEIKARNTIQGDEDLKATSSLPFFLDFRNVDEEKKKLTEQIRKELMGKKQKKDEERDKLLSDDLHQINLTLESDEQEIAATWSMLCSLSIAELDYQLRRFLLTPNNGPVLTRMLTHIMKQPNLNNLQINVIAMRFLDLLGSDLFSAEMKEWVAPLLHLVRGKVSRQDPTIQRSLAIIDHK